MVRKFDAKNSNVLWDITSEICELLASFNASLALSWLVLQFIGCVFGLCVVLVLVGWSKLDIHLSLRCLIIPQMVLCVIFSWRLWGRIYTSLHCAAVTNISKNHSSLIQERFLSCLCTGHHGVLDSTEQTFPPVRLVCAFMLLGKEMEGCKLEIIYTQ